MDKTTNQLLALIASEIMVGNIMRLEYIDSGELGDGYIDELKSQTQILTRLTRKVNRNGK